MFHFYQAIQNRAGDALAGYFVQAVNAVDAIVTIASDNSGTPIITTSGIANMAKVGANGMVSFYIADGNYTVKIFAPDGTTLRETYPDVPMASSLSLAIGTITTLSSGASATASINTSVTPALLSLGIPTGPAGPNGGTGASAGNAALFTGAAGMTIGTGITSFRTAGYSVGGKGGAEYVYDATVNAAYVTANPRSSFLAADGRGFRISLLQRIDVTMFGAVADFVTDDLTAFNAAMATLPSTGGELKIPAGRYYLSDTLNLHKTIRLTGEGTDWNGAGSTILRFPANVNGLVINHNNTHSDGDGTQGSATGSTIEGLALWGGNVSVNGAGAVTSYSNGTSTSGHGVRIRTTGVKLRDVDTICFGGDGFNIECFAGTAGYFQGNANNFELSFCQAIYNRRHGFFCKGTDVNAGLISICSSISNGGGGFIDYSFLGNTYNACHVRDCGKVDPTGTNGPVGACTYGGTQWYVVAGQEAAASTTTPGTNSAVWQSTNSGPKVWTSGLTWVNGSCYGSDLSNVNACNVFTGCYAESSQPPVQLGYPSIIIGGLLRAAGLGAYNTATYLEGGGNVLKVPALVATTAGNSSVYVGYVQGVNSQTDILGNNFGATNTSFKLMIDASNRLQTQYGGGYAYLVDVPTGQTPNTFKPRFLGICDTTGDPTTTRLLMRSTAAPTTGTWTQGDIVLNTSATATGILLWVCTASGTPGTWTAVYSATALVANSGSAADLTTGTLARPVASTGAVTSISPSAGVGYATGAGGTATQLTSKATGVTLSKVCGQITLNNASLAASSVVSFTFTNSQIAATDVIRISTAGGVATPGSYIVQSEAMAAGSCTISVRNMTAGALAEAIVCNFVIIKAVNS